MSTPNPKNNLQRHQARCCAVQALYQWHFTRQLPKEIIQQFAEEGLLTQVDRNYFAKAVETTIAEQAVIDEYLAKQADRDIKQLNPVELAILRLAIYELIHCPEVPYRVVVNEALEITKSYGATQGHKYVNAVLDRVSQELRTHEKIKKPEVKKEGG